MKIGLSTIVGAGIIIWSIPVLISIIVLYYIIKCAVRNGIKEAYDKITGKKPEEVDVWSEEYWNSDSPKDGIGK